MSNLFGYFIKALNVAKPHLDEALLVYRAKKCTTTDELDLASTASAIIHVFLLVVSAITSVVIVQCFHTKFVSGK